MAELADALDSGSSEDPLMQVRFLLSAPKPRSMRTRFFNFHNFSRSYICPSPHTNPKYNTTEVKYMSNLLIDETSPYLLQHAENPVEWYPWCTEAFERAAAEDKPIFLSIGYSTCHWCHVMAHESFEDMDIAAILNRHFISIKVDKEERPDIDNIYMATCQAFTGSGGWPTSIFMTSDQKPFFAGTYFPKHSHNGMIGFYELLTALSDMWDTDRKKLLKQADEIISHIKDQQKYTASADKNVLSTAISLFKHTYDNNNGGFGRAPKFPCPHNLLFLLSYYEHYKDDECLNMVEHTLQQMYKGGLFDHIGYGFCRYSTDSRFLVPHFEKMLYDNALLILAYCKAYSVTQKPIYLDISKKTADYILREMTSPEGGFYSAQDADIDGEEGKYYLFTPDELTGLLGKQDGSSFCHLYDITPEGNFEGLSIPNLLGSSLSVKNFDCFLPKIREYRRERYSLHRDDKILTSWNSLMIIAMCELYRISKDDIYLMAAKNGNSFIWNNLQTNNTLYVSFRREKKGVEGFLDDYAAYIWAQLSLYDVTLNNKYLQRAQQLCDKVMQGFSSEEGGFYLYSNNSEELILRPKETYDGAMPSGNSLMAYVLLRLSLITDNNRYSLAAKQQICFISAEASNYPIGHSMALLAILQQQNPPAKITIVWDGKTDMSCLPFMVPTDSVLILIDHPTEEYALINGRTTFYVCKDNRCMAPVNDLTEIF